MSETRTARTYCRVCTVQCGLVVEIEGERVGRIKGDTAHPASKGYSCPKGRALGQVHHHPDAILHPQMRTDGVLVNSDWDRVLDDLAVKLVAIRDKYGPQSIGIFFGSGLGMDASGYRMAEALLAGLGTPAKFTPMTIDGCAKVLVACMVGGFPGLSPRPDYDRAKCVLMVGVNPMVSHGHNIAMVNPGHILKDVTARGALWVIDPVRTESAVFATGHLAPIRVAIMRFWAI